MSTPGIEEQRAAEVRRIERALERCARAGGPPSAVALRMRAYLGTLGRRRQALCRELLLLDAAAYRLMSLEVERQKLAAAARAAAAAAAPPEGGE